MRHYDPLAKWMVRVMARSLRGAPAPAPAPRAAPDPLLDRLEKYVAKPGAGRDLYKATAVARSNDPFSGEDVARAQALHPRLWEVGGSGVQFVEEELLDRLARAAEPSTTPFWLAALERSRVGDAFAPQRRTMAVAALGLIALQRHDAAALAALDSLLEHRLPDVRARAAEYIGVVLAALNEGAPPALVARLTDLARNDRQFEPRFAARGALSGLGLPVPFDVPRGVIRFEVTLLDTPGVARTIEVASEQSLLHLHNAILTALRWDSDHLFAFYLNGDLRDARYEVPEPAFDMGLGLRSALLELGPPPVERSADDASVAGSLEALGAMGIGPALAPPVQDTDEDPQGDDEGDGLLAVPLGELGLVRGQRIAYRYDFGDDRRFEVKVLALEPKRTPRTTYPRVTAKKGKAPPQYSRW